MSDMSSALATQGQAPRPGAGSSVPILLPTPLCPEPHDIIPGVSLASASGNLCGKHKLMILWLTNMLVSPKRGLGGGGLTEGSKQKRNPGGQAEAQQHVLHAHAHVHMSCACVSVNMWEGGGAPLLAAVVLAPSLMPLTCKEGGDKALKEERCCLARPAAEQVVFMATWPLGQLPGPQGPDSEHQGQHQTL